MTVRLVASLDVEAWRAELPSDADVYQDPGYVTAAALGDPAWLAVVEGRGARLVIPFVERPLPAWLHAPGLRDAESPYGYAGVLASGDPNGWPLCRAEFCQALADRSIVNVFLRMNPLLPVEPLEPWLLPWQQSTAWIPLDSGSVGAFAGRAGRTHRSQVARAHALGFSAEITEGPGRGEVEEFRELYNQTMTRLGASEWYRFPTDYYERLRAALASRLLLVRVRDRTSAQHSEALFMRGPQWAHYHLSARRPDAHNVAGNLVFQAAAEWGADRGLTGIHLGGGTTPAPDDPLFLYKARIGRMRGTFRAAGIVALPDRHRELLERWCGVTGREPRRFQAYRQAPATVAPTAR